MLKELIPLWGRSKRRPIPYLDDSGENQLWEPDAVGLAMQVLKNQVIELFDEAILGRGSRNRDIR